MPLKPDEPAILDSMGWVHYRLGNHELALDLPAPCPGVAERRGDRRPPRRGPMGHRPRDEAWTVWEAALKEHPEHRLSAARWWAATGSPSSETGTVTPGAGPEAAAWPAPAKLNLMLRILGRRPDGYHRLQTVFQFIDRCDRLWLDAADRMGRSDDSPPSPVSRSRSDLTVRAARALQEATGCRLGAEIRIDKVLPMGGGLGGGSSDAATTLVALNRLWGTGSGPRCPGRTWACRSGPMCRSSCAVRPPGVRGWARTSPR